MNKRGFSLVELMVAVMILGIVCALTYPAFIRLMTASKGETSSNSAHLDKLNSQELIRLDFEHANYGIAVDEAIPPLVWPGPTATKTLTINSTINNTNSRSIGWLLYNCSAAGSALSANLIKDSRQDTTNTCITLLDANRRFEVLTRTTQNCPANGIFTAYPVSNGTCAATPENHYTSVSYRLSNTSGLSTCANGTRNLLRVVGAGAGEPILNCVADFELRFDLDTDGDGTADTTQTSPPGTTTQILNQVKNINMYILMQAGNKDQYLNSNEDINLDVALSKAAVTEDPSKFRWKVVRISGKPMSW